MSGLSLSLAVMLITSLACTHDSIQEREQPRKRCSPVEFSVRVRRVHFRLVPDPRRHVDRYTHEYTHDSAQRGCVASILASPNKRKLLVKGGFVITEMREKWRSNAQTYSYIASLPDVILQTNCRTMASICSMVARSSALAGHRSEYESRRGSRLNEKVGTDIFC